MTYGKEPFDLRLTILCMCRRLPVILAVTLLGTVLFGGGYYVKNVLLRGQRLYTATSVYRVAYAAEEKDVGAVYINEMSWNTYIQSQMFLDAVRFHLEESAGKMAESAGDQVGTAGNQADGSGGQPGTAGNQADGSGGQPRTAGNQADGSGGQPGIVGNQADDSGEQPGIVGNQGDQMGGAGEGDGAIPGNEALGEMLQAYLASDLRVPSIVVTSDSPEKSIWIAQAAEAAMTQEFAHEIREIVSISVIDPGDTAKEVIPDVRVGRAFVLSAVLSCFFVIVAVLLQVIGEDGIRLPSTIWKRYGVRAVGTIESKELGENLNYFFRRESAERKGVIKGDNKVKTAVGASFNKKGPGEEGSGGKDADGEGRETKKFDEKAAEGKLLTKVAVCAVQKQVDAAEVLKRLRKICPEIMISQEANGQEGKGNENKAHRADGWFAVSAPLAHPEVSSELREADGILLAVSAGAHGGRQFERVLEYLRQQDCNVTAAILWDADEKLIRSYYAFERNGKKG